MKLELNIKPKHVALIMDGNGRWAKERGLERSEGHVSGVDALRSSIAAALDLGIEYLTVYAFSKENWNRPDDEVNGLMSLFCSVIALESRSLNERGVRVIFLSEKEKLSSDVLKTLSECTEMTKNNSVMTLVVALNYGSRSEIVHAVRDIAEKVKGEEIDICDINEEMISNHLMTNGVPDPDLVIRTSGECRISNFLLWQISYSEFIFCQKYWPDFTKEDFEDALVEFTRRKRRFGKSE